MKPSFGHDATIKAAAPTSGVLFKSSPIHGTGGFANTDLPAGFRIIQYVGERIDKAESLRRCAQNNEYIFSLDAEHDLDGNVDWNLARFINHSCAANCDAEFIAGKVWIVSNRSILAGEELTFNYGYDLEDYRQYPCSCGSPQCVGYMVAEELLESVREARRR